MTTAEQMENGPRFSAVIISRQSHERPSEMEIQLRSHCERIRVVQDDLNGCHMQLSKEAIAIRVYYPSDIQRFDEQAKNKNPLTSVDILTMLEEVHGNAGNDDIDGLASFRDKNMCPVVVCVLPRGNIEFFDKPDSFVNRIQRIMRGSAGSKSGHVIFAPDTPTAMKSLISMSNALTPRKQGLRQKYFAKQRADFYIPDDSGVVPHPNGAASAAAGALYDWAHEYEIPQGEHNVLMSYLGSLANIATADDEKLASVPVESDTKAILHIFFGSKGNTHSSSRAAVHDPEIPGVVEVLPFQLNDANHQTRVAQALNRSSDIESPLRHTRLFPGIDTSYINNRTAKPYMNPFQPVEGNRAGFPQMSDHALYRPQAVPTATYAGEDFAAYLSRRTSYCSFQRPTPPGSAFGNPQLSSGVRDGLPSQQQLMVPTSLHRTVRAPQPASRPLSTLQNHYPRQDHDSSYSQQYRVHSRGLLNQNQREIHGQAQWEQMRTLLPTDHYEQQQQLPQQYQPHIPSNPSFHRRIRRFE